MTETEPRSEPPMADASDRPMAPWWPVVGSVALLAAAYLGDRAVGAAFEFVTSQSEPPATSDFVPIVAASMVVRVLLLSLLGGLGWFAFHGPRRRFIGLGLVVIGLYLPIGRLIYLATADSSPVILPLADPSLAGDFAIWMSAGIVALGGAMMIRPTGPPQPAP